MMGNHLREYVAQLAPTRRQWALLRLRVQLLNGPIRCPYCPGTRKTRRNRIASSQSLGRHIGWCHSDLVRDWKDISGRFKTIQARRGPDGYITAEALLRTWEELDNGSATAIPSPEPPLPHMGRIRVLDGAKGES